MTSFPTKSSCKIRTALLGLLLATAALQPALARERSSQLSGPHGQTVQRETTRQQGDVSSTTTGPQGRQWKRSVDRAASGSTASVTGPQGQSVSRSTTVAKSASAPQ